MEVLFDPPLLFTKPPQIALVVVIEETEFVDIVATLGAEIICPFSVLPVPKPLAPFWLIAFAGINIRFPFLSNTLTVLITKVKLLLKETQPLLSLTNKVKSYPPELLFEGNGITNGEEVIEALFITLNEGKAFGLLVVKVKLVKVKLVEYGIKN